MSYNKQKQLNSLNSMKKWYLLLFFFIAVLGVSYSQQKSDIAGLTIYPNPVTQGVVYITTENNLPKDVVIYDVFGTVKLQKNIGGNELYVPGIEAGIYVMRITENGITATRKLIVK